MSEKFSWAFSRKMKEGVMANQGFKKWISDRFYMGLRSTACIVITLATVVAVLAAIDRGSYIIVNTVVLGGMWALMAMGLALIFGVMNIPSFVHGEFFMIGGLGAFYVFTPLNDYLVHNPNPLLAMVAPLIAIFTASVSGILVGFLIDLMVFRPLRKRTREQWVMNTFVLTLGLSAVMINGHLLILGPQIKGIVHYWDFPSLSILGTFVSLDRVFIFILSMLVVISFWIFMKFSKKGRAIRAVSQDERGAMMVGINLSTIQTLSLGLGCGLAALAGACLLFMYPSYPTVGIWALYNSWNVLIISGLGNVAGAVPGGFIMALFQVLTTAYVGEGWGYVIPMSLAVLTLVFKPSGLFGSKVRSLLDR
jgi:branched-chain amino acid transport system permease protein